jgi:hypothetical protein
MGHLLKLICAHSPLNLPILSSAPSCTIMSVNGTLVEVKMCTLMMVHVPNLTLTSHQTDNSVRVVELTYIKCMFSFNPPLLPHPSFPHSAHYPLPPPPPHPPTRNLTPTTRPPPPAPWDALLVVKELIWAGMGMGGGGQPKRRKGVEEKGKGQSS